MSNVRQSMKSRKKTILSQDTNQQPKDSKSISLLSPNFKAGRRGLPNPRLSMCAFLGIGSHKYLIRGVSLLCNERRASVGPVGSLALWEVPKKMWAMTTLDRWATWTKRLPRCLVPPITLMMDIHWRLLLSRMLKWVQAFSRVRTHPHGRKLQLQLWKKARQEPSELSLNWRLFVFRMGKQQKNQFVKHVQNTTFGPGPAAYDSLSSLKNVILRHKPNF